MAKYKDIVGTAVRNNAGNIPTAETGQVFFDSTNVDFKYQFPAVTTSGSWATVNNLNTGKDQTAGAGSPSTALNFGGGPPNSALTEKWNGSSWTEVNDLNTARRAISGTGISGEAALAFSGLVPSAQVVTE